MANIPTCTAPDFEVKPSTLTLPKGATDTHAHVFDDIYPLHPNRSYTPAKATKKSYIKMLQTLGFSRAVLVQPSVYGMDNSAILDCMAETASGIKYRGVVVINNSISDTELATLQQQGVRGVRMNLLFKGGINEEEIIALGKRIAKYGWHFQLLLDVSKFNVIHEFVKKLPVDVVVDHMGHMPVHLGINNPGFASLLSAIETGKVWVKLSAAYRITAEQTVPYNDVAVIAKTLLNANPERMLYGTDWPHPSIEVPMPNDADLLDMFGEWCPNNNIRQQVLTRNPQLLYQFEDTFA